MAEDFAGAALVRRETFFFTPPVLTRSADGVTVTVAGCEPYGVPGRPLLPVRGVVLEAPPGCRAGRVVVLPGEAVEIEPAAPVISTPEAIPLSGAPARLPLGRRDERVYGRREIYPDYGVDDGARWRPDRRRGAAEVTVPLYPVRLAPAENRLLFYPEITVEVSWLPQDEAVAPAAAGRRGPAALDASPLAPGRYTHVIITTQELATAGAPWNLAALAAAREASGVSSRIVTVDWIYGNYDGRDSAERIRNFLRDAHQAWRTRYALLVGNVQRVPTRQLYCKFDSNMEMIAADGVYYGCLDGDFDSNGNNIFGEIGDGPEGGDIDLAAEIYVGRFPVTTVKELQHMVRKTLTYEAQPAAKLGRIGYVGEYLGFGGESEYADGALLAIRQGSQHSGYNTLGFENPDYGGAFANAATLNDSPTNTWSKPDMLRLFNQDVQVFNHLGHGSRQYCFKLNFNSFNDEQQMLGLTNKLPALAYSQACDSGWYDGSPRCFAERFVTVSNAAFAAVMNSRSGWGYQGNVDGPSQRFHRMFWDVIFRGEAATLGEANALAKERLRHLVDPASGDVARWCYYTINLFGDPATPFAARALRQPPRFGHLALENSFVTNAPQAIVVDMAPYGLVEQASPRLLWFTGDAPQEVHTNTLAHNTPEELAAAIPPQSLGTTVNYALTAATIAGVTGRWPETGWHAFAITPPLALEVEGAPAAWGSVAPVYGVNTIASGVVVRATAPERVLEGNGVSRALAGASLNGIASTAAPPGVVEFALERPSQLVWQWRTEHALQYTSNIPRLLRDTVWLTPDMVVDSRQAPATVVYTNKTQVFSGWYLDGQRQPAAPGVIANPVQDVAMAAPHTAYALYIPIDRDADGNGLPDWWEYRYFGAAGLDAGSDFDNDGFSLAEEYADRTDPLDSSSYPQPPLIMHTPLDAVQARPPPYTVEAVITDSHQVATAVMAWRQNGGAWQTNAMTLAAAESNLYRTVIAAPARPGDTFAYRLVAGDPAGHVAEHGPHLLALVYPQAVFAPTSSLSVVSGGDVEVGLSLTNAGNSVLSWQLAVGAAEAVGREPGAWVTNAYGQPWTITTSRFVSPPYAFHGRAASAGTSSSPPVHAGLRSPGFTLAPGARLFFKYWIAGELDKRNVTKAFDGGIVMVSTNGGADFAQLAGPYTHQLSGWKYSPWEDGTPCLSGNGGEGWREAAFPLDGFAGQEVCFMFLYGGDNNTDGEGWYIDDIRLGPTLPQQWPPWLACGATAGALAAGRGLGIPAYLMSGAMAARQALAALHLVSNDPVAPNITIDIALKLRDPPLLLGVSGAQTSTNGEGVVTISAAVAERDGEPLTVEVEYSRDGGATWEQPRLLGATALFGQPLASTNEPLVAGVDTMRPDGSVATNVAALRWGTFTAAPPLPPLATGVLARARVWSPYFASEYLTGAPFMIDNEPPSAPEGVKSLSHYPRLWLSAAAFNAAWQPSGDGNGIGGLVYRWDLWPGNEGTLTNAVRHAGTNATLAAFTGSNIWFAVQALDACGNASAVVKKGPYYMDLAPPLAGAAFLEIARSRFGDYVVGPDMNISWGGFSDAHSGILGYYLVALADDSPAAPLFTTSTCHTLPAPLSGVENIILLYAVDRAGNISPILDQAVMVLDPDADADSDGFTAAAEELAGTDATDPHSFLRLGLAGARLVAEGTELLVVWQSLEGRRYTLQGTASLAPPQWLPLPGATALPGVGALVTNAIVTSESPLFLRLHVAPEN